MKLAIVCSWLNQYGGAERVLEVVHDMYPQAPIYTSIYRPEALPESYRTWDIRPSFLNRLPLIKRKHQLFLPLYPLAFESLDLRGYDVVLSLTSAFGHGVLTPPETRHICYCLTPARFLWNYHAYIEREGLGRLARWVLRSLFAQLAPVGPPGGRPRGRVRGHLAHRAAAHRQILPPRVPHHLPAGGYDALGGARRARTTITWWSRGWCPTSASTWPCRRFNRLGLPLRIIGEGRDRAALAAMAGPNVQFLGYRSDDEVREQMARCRALIFPGEEDFGITPLEAMAVGRPVVAYGAGGALDTIAEGRTGVFFREPTPESLAEAVHRLEQQTFDPLILRRHAAQFGRERFCREMDAVLTGAAQGPAR